VGAFDHRSARGCPPHCSHRVSPVWFAPYVDANERIEASMRSVHEAEKATKVVERVVRRGAVSAHRRIAHAFDLLIQAHDRVT